MQRIDVVGYIVRRYKRTGAHEETKILLDTPTKQFIMMCEVERNFRLKFKDRDELWRNMYGMTIGELADRAMKADKQGITKKKY